MYIVQCAVKENYTATGQPQTSWDFFSESINYYLFNLHAIVFIDNDSKIIIIIIFRIVQEGW